MQTPQRILKWEQMLLLGFFVVAAVALIPLQAGAVVIGGSCGSVGWTEYKCENKGVCLSEKPNNILKRTVTQLRHLECTTVDWEETEIEVNGKKEIKRTPIRECVCEDDGLAYEEESPAVACGQSRVCAGPEEWQRANAIPNWCSCEGKCYIPPTPKELQDETLQPKNVFETQGEGDPKKPKLPVVLGWQDNAAKQIVADGCSVGSYVYEITGGTKPVSGAINANELQTMMKDCRLSPHTSYAWKTKTCIDAQGENCGIWSQEKQFTASLAPEPKTPLDPDFESVKSGTSGLPVTLQWCASPSANAYKVSIKNPDGTVANEHLFEKYATKYPDIDLFTIFKKGLRYVWSVFSCESLNADNCPMQSQKWSVVPISELDVPTGLRSKAVVNLEDSLSWNLVSYAPFYMVRIENSQTAQRITRTTDANSFPVARLWSELQKNSAYSWKVAACASDDLQGSTCTAWSISASFQTTGAPPKDLATSPFENNLTGVPFTLQWKAQEGALSYAYEIAPDQTFSASVRKGVREADQHPKIEVAYKDSDGEQSNAVRPGQTYYARVATCADQLGIECGQWTILPIATAPLKAPDPVSPLPSQDAYTPKVGVSWKKTVGQNYYAYRVFYEKPSPEEKNASCLQYQKEKPVSEGIADSPAVSYTPPCVGTYKAEITPCTDTQCKEKGTPAVWTFQVREPATASPFFGIVPCGRAKDNISTPWNERESCQFKHIVLSAHNLFAFLLWRAIPAIAVLYAIFSGAIFYFSLGNPGVLVQIKSIWKAMGIGFLIVLFSWVFINLFLDILGFNINIFGRWHELKL